MRRCTAARLLPRPIATLVAGLMVLQAFLAGLAVARSALIAPDPLGISVICHGGGGSNTDDGTPADPIKEIHQCCFACMAGSVAATLPQQPSFPGFGFPRSAAGLAVWFVDIPIADRSIRAGQSQAPPGRA